MKNTKNIELIGGMDAAVTKPNGVFAKQKLQRTKLAGMLILFAIALTAVMVITAASCSKSGGGGGGKSLNSAEDLKAYLDKQPANSPDKPIKIAMKLNEPMFPKVRKVIDDAGKYVSLDLSGSPTTTIPKDVFRKCELLAGIIIPKGVTSIGSSAFEGCTSLTSVNIPDNVTSIERYAFYECTSLTSVNIPDSITTIEGNAFKDCTSLTSVTFQGTIPSNSFGGTVERYGIRDWRPPFDGDLRDKYLKDGIGTYTTTAPVDYWDSKWTKK